MRICANENLRGAERACLEQAEDLQNHDDDDDNSDDVEDVSVHVGMVLTSPQ